MSTAIGLLVMSLLACGDKEAPEANPTVSVQVATVAHAKLERKVTSEAVLYPIDQAAIVPKISAPVQKFLVGRGDRVHRGELLAVLEHGDLAASLTEKGSQAGLRKELVTGHQRHDGARLTASSQ